jgi:hypothetical protein
MNPGMFADCLELYQGWSRTLASAAWAPWRVLASQLDVVFAAFGGRRDAPGEMSGARGLSEPVSEEALQRVALERARQGLPPPREVYDARNRDRIDWAEFPSWARPTDPELFEGCTHEG